MKLQILSESFALCRANALPEGLCLSAPLFLAMTDEEISIVCPSDRIPCDIEEVEDGWRALRIAGQLHFSLVGILRSLLDVLSKNGIPVCAVSTYNTDYLFIKQENFNRALALLTKAGHELEYL